MPRRPFNGNVNIFQEYGVVRPGSRRGYHTGVDYAMEQGRDVLAPENGTIQQNGDGRSSADGRGFFILLKGDSGTMHCLYHLSQMGHASGRVSEGQHIGESGNTGLSSGPHLHWETRKAPFDGNSDFPPSQWLFSGQPIYVPPTPQPVPTTQFVRLFGDFRTLRVSPGGAEKAKIYPNSFGSLTYKILSRSGDYIQIQTQMFGTGWIFVGASVSSLTQYFNA